MRLLLDAHALLWWLGDNRRLSREAARAISGADEPLVGAGTLVEIAVKRSLGKLTLDASWPDEMVADGFGVLAVSLAHVSRLQDLPFPRLAGKPHRDPFDRLLAAQALIEKIPVVSRDSALTAYGVTTIW
ncbi:MAG: PIN domain-containing protein [Luteitalea sp.]|nr:PIN domain-containing protein [Luteitalea sp.]